MPKQTDAERVAKVAGPAYLAWLNANGLKDSAAFFVAFMAGWTICDGNQSKQK